MKKIILITTLFLAVAFSDEANTNKENEKICTGFAKWTKDGEFKTIRSKCITKKEYGAN